MGLFRRDRRTLNERLLDSYGERAENEPIVLIAEEDDDVDPVEELSEELVDDPVAWEVGDYWAVIAGAQDAELRRESYEFMALPDGELVVDESCDESLSALADAVEELLDPPYRAVAVRQGAEWWSVSARPSELEPLEVTGDRLRLTRVDGEVTLTLDGEAVHDSALADRLAERVGAGTGDCVVDCVCVDGNVWELRAFVTPPAEDDGA